MKTEKNSTYQLLTWLKCAAILFWETGFEPMTFGLQYYHRKEMFLT